MGIGVWQIVLILVIVVIIFGAGKIPRVMGDVAKGIKSFKAGMKDEMAENGDDKAPIADSSARTAEDAEKKEDAANG
jgi:sec-independent protein translocase protein TatA